MKIYSIGILLTLLGPSIAVHADLNQDMANYEITRKIILKQNIANKAANEESEIAVDCRNNNQTIKQSSVKKGTKIISSSKSKLAQGDEKKSKKLVYAKKTSGNSQNNAYKSKKKAKN